MEEHAPPSSITPALPTKSWSMESANALPLSTEFRDYALNVPVIPNGMDYTVRLSGQMAAIGAWAILSRFRPL